MEWFNKMMEALNYIERNMEEQMDMADIARVACSSPFHFQRMFHMLTGMTVAEYIRKRRLTLAAQELAVSSHIRVLDVALKYGYDSPESFAKAFRRVHGISPSAARESGVSLKAFPRLSFHLSLKGDKDMDYKIFEKDAFPVLGKTISVSTREGENFREIPKFWGQCQADGTVEKLCSFSGSLGLMGICTEMDHEKEQMTYMVAVESTGKEQEPDLVTKIIPAGTWAVFTSIGSIPGAIQKVWERIYHEWFPATGYEHAEAPEIEVYPPGNPGAEDYRCEVWVPIINKK